jgi:hypothetical protein
MDLEDRFEHAVTLIFRNWARVGTFNRVAALGWGPAASVFAEEAQKSLAAPVEQEAQKRLSAPVDLGSESFVEFLKKHGCSAYAELQVNDAQAAVDAASLVFVHSVVDDAAFTCCTLTAMAKPEKWEPLLREKQVTLGEVKAEGYDTLFENALKRRLRKLEHESLLVKADLILSLCKPDGSSSNLENLHNYVYDRCKLSQIDEARHAVVHRGSGAAELRRSSFGDCFFLFQTGLYFLDLFSLAYRPQDPRNKAADS